MKEKTKPLRPYATAATCADCGHWRRTDYAMGECGLACEAKYEGAVPCGEFDAGGEDATKGESKCGLHVRYAVESLNGQTIRATQERLRFAARIATAERRRLEL